MPYLSRYASPNLDDPIRRAAEVAADRAVNFPGAEAEHTARFASQFGIAKALGRTLPKGTFPGAEAAQRASSSEVGQIDSVQAPSPKSTYPSAQEQQTARTMEQASQALARRLAAMAEGKGHQPYPSDSGR